MRSEGALGAAEILLTLPEPLVELPQLALGLLELPAQGGQCRLGGQLVAVVLGLGERVVGGADVDGGRVGETAGDLAQVTAAPPVPLAQAGGLVGGLLGGFDGCAGVGQRLGQRGAARGGVPAQDVVATVVARLRSSFSCRALSLTCPARVTARACWRARARSARTRGRSGG